METKIQNQIIDFFSFLEDFYSTSKSCLKSCQNHGISINKIIIRCTNIKQAQLKYSPLEEFEGLQNKLLSSLHSIINVEVEKIQHELSIIEELFEKLCHKNRVLQESCRSVDFNESSSLITGTPWQPPLKQILQFASESITFGSQVSAQIETSLSILSLKRLETEQFSNHYKFPSPWQTRIPEILAYTSFCQENEL